MFEHKNDGILTLNVKELLIMHLFFSKNVIKIYKKGKKLSFSSFTEKCILRCLDDKCSLNLFTWSGKENRAKMLST